VDTSWQVLVIDENETWRRALLRGLSGHGFAVAVAPTWRQGFDLFEREGARVIVLDLLLPDAHGLLAIRELRGLCPDSAVLVCTAHGSIAAAVAAMRAGANDFLVKPTTHDHVAAAIRTTLEGRRGEPRPARDAILATPMPLARVHWEHIHRVLMESDWNVSEAARRLGIHRQSLQRKLRKIPVLRESDRSARRADARWAHHRG